MFLSVTSRLSCCYKRCCNDKLCNASFCKNKKLVKIEPSYFHQETLIINFPFFHSLSGYTLSFIWLRQHLTVWSWWLYSFIHLNEAAHDHGLGGYTLTFICLRQHKTTPKTFQRLWWWWCCWLYIPSALFDRVQNQPLGWFWYSPSSGSPFKNMQNRFWISRGW